MVQPIIKLDSSGSIEWINESSDADFNIYLAAVDTSLATDMPLASVEFNGIDPAVGGTARLASLVLSPVARAELSGIAPTVTGGNVIVTAQAAGAEFNGVAPALSNIVNTPVASAEFSGIQAPALTGHALIAPCASAEFRGIFDITVTGGNVIVTAPVAAAEFNGIEPIIISIPVVVGEPGDLFEEIITDSVVMQGGAAALKNIFSSILDQLFAYENSFTAWGKTAASALNLSSASTGLTAVLARDLFSAKESLMPWWTGVGFINDSFNYSDYAERVRTAVAEVEEFLNLNTLASAQLIALVREALRVRETLAPSARFGASVSDSAALAGEAVCSWVAALLEALNMQSAPVIQFGSSILDDIQVSGSISTSGVFGKSAAETLGLNGQASAALLALAQSVLDLAGQSAAVFTAVQPVSESLAMAGDAVIVRKSCLDADDLLALGGLMAANGSYCVAVQDAFRLDVHVIFAGDDGETWECYVLNTTRFHPSVYTGFSFNSFCTFEGRTFGAAKDGIYEIAGGTDEGDAIPTGVVLSQTDFGVPNRKRFRRAYLGISGDVPVMAMATEDGTGIIYEIREDQTVAATRSMVGKKWTLTVADFDKLDFISLVPVILARGR